MTRRSAAIIASLAIVAATAATLLAMGRPPVCACGRIELWGPAGPTQSQMLADWYSPSHIVHGILFYALLWFAARRWTTERRFVAALAVECLWEVVENTPIVIGRYREATAALGYTGDSVINSLSDVAMMVIGFLAARRLPLWATAALLLALELAPLLAVRDNLTLNIWMLLAPSDSIRAWQTSS